MSLANAKEAPCHRTPLFKDPPDTCIAFQPRQPPKPPGKLDRSSAPAAANSAELFTKSQSTEAAAKQSPNSQQKPSKAD